MDSNRTNLKDPNLPPHAIIEERADGSALRNDGRELYPANKNPWYVLATVFGEQPEEATWFDYDEELAARNRRAWNGWFCGDLDSETRAARAKSAGLDPAELAPLTADERQEIVQRFQARLGPNAEMPSRTEHIAFFNIYFAKICIFDKFVFEKVANFSSSIFSVAAKFGVVTFSDFVFFASVMFSDLAEFGSATFCGPADFSSATFSGYSSFGSATFCGPADFSSATFKSATRFDNAHFLTAVPEFFAAEIYEDTTFPIPEKYGDNWPPTSGTVELEGKDKPVEVMPADKQKRAYNRLRLFMNKNLHKDEEQFFHRMEMRCKKKIGAKFYRCLNGMFELFSDYGNSVGRPLMSLLVLWLFGVACKLVPVSICLWGEQLPNAMGWSFANLFPLFGFRRLYFGAGDFEGWLAVVGGGLTVAGFVLLFFLGLGLRNRFRLR